MCRYHELPRPGRVPDADHWSRRNRNTLANGDDAFVEIGDPLFIDKIREIVDLYLSPSCRRWCF
ncbi:hypothetical protein AM571_PC01317 (plasmid) [Rhizobium etli 8C-3]|uniref:Uncharacterized protein n=1 Tax=Rhizobium etli 8C-3 TaxID=538025 RepID=A0A1L5PG92_RHIET|nr:hypothetical protein AM571_PC01317 [Rhizobium etli 8C-3]